MNTREALRLVLHDALSQPSTPTMRIDYTNHRGERAWRLVLPNRVFWGTIEWHPKPGWLFRAIDLEKKALRTFAIDNIHAIEWASE